MFTNANQIQSKTFREVFTDLGSAKSITEVDEAIFKYLCHDILKISPRVVCGMVYFKGTVVTIQTFAKTAILFK